MTSLRITAVLDRPSIGLVEHPLILDGPVAWAVAQLNMRDQIPMEPLTREHAPDLDLPFERWEKDGTWGWKVSQATLTVDSYTAIEIRRKPATAEFARFTTEKKHHSGLGPHKARDTTVSAAWVSQAVWDAEVTDRARLDECLNVITHLGAHAAIGYGHVASWTVQDVSPGGWEFRPMPSTTGRVMGVRPPYWHHTRKALSTIPATERE